jgi:DNA-binding Lrp family transcriptional regulator
MNNKKSKTALPFIRAYNTLLARTDLTPAEKLVLCVICKYWPSPFWGSNSAIAESLGCSERYAEMLIRRLANKKIITKGYTHINKNGSKHTVRVIVPMCFAEKCKKPASWIMPEQPFGQTPEEPFGQSQNKHSFSPEQPFDLLERNIKENIKATSLTLPADERSKTLAENRDARQSQPLQPTTPTVRNFSQVLKGSLHYVPTLTQAELEKRRQEQIRKLRQAYLVSREA